NGCGRSCARSPPSTSCSRSAIRRKIDTDREQGNKGTGEQKSGCNAFHRGGRLISFTKAHACGNDFLIVTEEVARGRDWAELTRRLCARNTGIGADGIEFFTWTGPKTGRIRLHNADGSIAEIS